VRRNILEPAVQGIRNLLQSCVRSGTVKRVVFTSSISTLTAKDEKGHWKQLVDESSINSANLIWKTKNSGWVLSLNFFSSKKKEKRKG
jgi:nucleoside-diphosphate-sugar epimerase